MSIRYIDCLKLLIFLFDRLAIADKIVKSSQIVKSVNYEGTPATSFRNFPIENNCRLLAVVRRWYPVANGGSQTEAVPTAAVAQGAKVSHWVLVS
uniref:Secreted protein n=1 Tax=Caenorhabditis japonica TaxID=281687 RepID=A0A8R1E9J6_CAEJA